MQHFKIANPENPESELLALRELDYQNRDGCFESIRIRADGHLPLWHWHEERLKNALKAKDPGMETSFAEHLPHLIQKAPVGIEEDMRLKLSVVFTAREYPEVYISIQKAELIFCPLDEMKAVSFKNALKSQGSLTFFKHLDRFLYEASLTFAGANGAEEALIFNSNLEPIETSRFNFLIKKGEQWFTPKLSQGQIKGVMRTFVEESGLLPNIKEEILTLNDLYGADEILLSNAFQGLVPLYKLDEISYSTQVGSALQNQLREIWQRLP